MNGYFKDYIAHYGKGHDDNPPGRGSGRYPYGSGDKYNKSTSKTPTTTIPSHLTGAERDAYIRQELSSGDLRRIMGVANDPSVSYDQLKKAVDKAKLLQKTLDEANPSTLSKMDKTLSNVDKGIKYYDTGKKLLKIGADVIKVTQFLMKILDKLVVVGETASAAGTYLPVV